MGRAIYRDRSFLGLLVTQFLGAFNDNVFKQIVLFVCLDLARDNRADSLQGFATTLFAIPFVALSGYCGFLSDRYGKRGIIITSKVLEIVAMTLGLGAFLLGSINAMLFVLFFMGAQSALFGPSKYGILPELFASEDLPRVNGVFLMTTFLAIILGFTTAGFVKSLIGDQLWLGALVCIVIAVVGTTTALMIRPTAVAHPNMEFHWSSLLIYHETWELMLRERRLLWVLAASSIFWLVGGVVYPPAINDLGGLQFQLDERWIGMLAACTGIGIAIGCVVGGILSHNQFDGRLVRIGLWGMLAGLIALMLPGSQAGTNLLGPLGSAVALIWLGLCAGLFTVPLQVYLQAKSPIDQKGRIIGALNLANWIGISTAGIYYSIWNKAFAAWHSPPAWMFGAAALLLIPLLVLFHPHSESLSTPENPSQTGNSL